MTFVIVMGFHQIIVVMNDVKRHTYIHTYICICSKRKNSKSKRHNSTFYLIGDTFDRIKAKFSSHFPKEKILKIELLRIELLFHK